MSNYSVFGSHQSLFTRKLVAALNFYNIAHEFMTKRGSGLESMIEERSGTHQIPILGTPENWMLADTTAIFAVLDARFTRRRMFPLGVGGLLVHLIEEVFDEWISRVMVHYRWHYPDSAAYASDQMCGGDPGIADILLTWGPKACRATGTELPIHQLAAEKEYQGLLAAMEKQLQSTKFLLGNKPTAVDCAALGGLHAHILNDPDPAKMVRSYPRVVSWAEQHTNNPVDIESAETAGVEVTSFAVHVLQNIAPAYSDFVLANKEALEKKNKSFKIHTCGNEASYLTRPYPELSRQMVVSRISHQLDREAQRTSESLLRQYDLHECFLP
ncbi:MAG: glutathione S-transferase family protein [Halioglobus sp.]